METQSVSHKPILVLQFRTDQSLQHEQKCLLTHGAFSRDELKFINILDPKTSIPQPKDLNNYSAIITAASGQFNITDWSQKTKIRIETLLPLFHEIIDRDFPTLAICFGHQLISKLLGGEVTRDENQAETGTHQVTLTPEGKAAPIFSGLPDSFYVVEGHKDSVSKLPKSATLLASSDNCRVQSYRIGNNIFTSQFHPELDLDDLVWRLKLYPEYLKGTTLETVIANYSQIPHAPKIVSNFKNLIFDGSVKSKVKPPTNLNA